MDIESGQTSLLVEGAPHSPKTGFIMVKNDDDDDGASTTSSHHRVGLGTNTPPGNIMMDNNPNSTSCVSGGAVPVATHELSERNLGKHNLSSTSSTSTSHDVNGVNDTTVLPPPPTTSVAPYQKVPPEGSIKSASSGTSSTGSPSSANSLAQHYKIVFCVLIFLVGACASAAFLAIGILNAQEDKTDEFDRMASEFVVKLQDAFQDYELFGLWIHESCRSRPHSWTDTTRTAATNNSDSTAVTNNVLGICSREEFRELYEYILSVGVDFQSAQFMPHVRAYQRAAMEAESRGYYGQNFPHVEYRGIVGLFPKEGGGLTVLPQAGKRRVLASSLH